MLPANELASIVVSRSGPWTDAWSLQKLLYYIQAWHLAITDEPLFEERIKAWKNGPVVPQVWHARRARGSRRAATQDVLPNSVDAFTSDLIDLVLATYGGMSGEELSALTHVEQPWREARGNLADDAECREEIDTQSMARFYRSHRKLANRTAADLAAAGLDVSAEGPKEPMDISQLLGQLPDQIEDDDPWGGANLEYPTATVETGSATRRFYTGV